MSEAPYRIQFDNARDPLTARNALGIDSVLAGYVTSVFATATYATKADFPATAWTAWSPTVSASFGAITSYTVTTARYQKAGKTITAFFDITITNAGTGGNFLLISPPVAISAVGGGGIFGFEVVTTGAMVGGNVLPAATNLPLAKYDGTSVVVTGYRVVCTAVYESA